MDKRKLLEQCSSRNDFGTLMNELGLLGEAVEIGVYEGEYSFILLETWKGRCLHLVDPWSEMNDYFDGMNAPTKICEERMKTTIRRLASHGGRFEIHRMRSSGGAKEFADGSLDFVYIDANHDYEHIVEDIALWFPKVRPGGIVAGHDYCDEKTSWYTCGVKSGVDEFVREKTLELFLTAEDGIVSWFCMVE